MPRSRLFALAALLVGPTMTPAGAKVADAWFDMPPLRTARQEVGVALLDGHVYVIGGILANRVATGIVERFDIEDAEWEAVPSLPEESRLHHIGAASAGGKVYAVGGLNPSFRGVRTLYAFDPATGWERMADLPTARGAMGVAAIDNRIYAAGGQDGSTSVASFAVYLVDENRWEELPDMPTARNHLAAAAVDGIFYTVGGRAGGLRPELEAYNPLENDWTTLSPIPTPRGGIAAAVVDDWIYVFGGEGNPLDPDGVFPHVESYDPRRDCWVRREDMQHPRHGIGAATMDYQVFVPGGSPVEGFGVTDVHDAFAPGSSLKDGLGFIRGDSNRDERVDLSDSVFTLLGLFADRQLTCLDAADADDSGAVNLIDAVFALNFLFRGGPPLPPPGPERGRDPTEDTLDCQR